MGGLWAARRAANVGLCSSLAGCSAEGLFSRLCSELGFLEECPLDSC